MNPETVLQIILRVLDIAYIVVQNMPPSEHQKFWIQHQKNVEFWQDLFKKLSPKEPS